MPLAQLPRRCVRYLIAIWENELARSCVQICVQSKRKSSYERARNCLVFNLWSHLDNGIKIKYREYQTFNPGIEMGRSR